VFSSKSFKTNKTKGIERKVKDKQNKGNRKKSKSEYFSFKENPRRVSKLRLG